jgi:hypothetical protein
MQYEWFRAVVPCRHTVLQHCSSALPTMLLFLTIICTEDRGSGTESSQGSRFKVLTFDVGPGTKWKLSR